MPVTDEAYTHPAALARIGAALTRGCVASISRIEAGEASRRRQIVVKELAPETLAEDNLALAA
jgi:hypothetical protein